MGVTHEALVSSAEVGGSWRTDELLSQLGTWKRPTVPWAYSPINQPLPARKCQHCFCVLSRGCLLRCQESTTLHGKPSGGATESTHGRKRRWWGEGGEGSEKLSGWLRAPDWAWVYRRPVTVSDEEAKVAFQRRIVPVNPWGGCPTPGWHELSQSLWLPRKCRKAWP